MLLNYDISYCEKLLEKVQIGKDGERTDIQRFINGACWLISVSRNAIVIIVGCVLAATLIEPGDDTPFEITGNTKRICCFFYC